jgi:hypothetical protein
MNNYLPRAEEVERAKLADRALPIPLTRKNPDYTNDGFTTETPLLTRVLHLNLCMVPINNWVRHYNFPDGVRQELAEYAATEDIRECIARVEVEIERQDLAPYCSFSCV